MNTLPTIEKPETVIFEQKTFQDATGRVLSRFVYHGGGPLPKHFPTVQWRGYAEGLIGSEHKRFEFWIRDAGSDVEKAFVKMVDAANTELITLQRNANRMKAAVPLAKLPESNNGSKKKNRGGRGKNRLKGK